MGLDEADWRVSRGELGESGVRQCRISLFRQSPINVHPTTNQNILMLSTERDFRHLPIVHEGFVFLHLS